MFILYKTFIVVETSNSLCKHTIAGHYTCVVARSINSVDPSAVDQLKIIYKLILNSYQKLFKGLILGLEVWNKFVFV